jgi:hypothetical protein
VGQKIQLPIEVLEKALASVSIAASADATRPHLTGICLRVHGSTFNIAATNGHWMALYCYTITGKDKPNWVDEQILMSRDCVYRMLREIRWILGHHHGVPEDGDFVVIDPEGKEYTTFIGTMKLDLINEQFPPISKIIPKKLPEKRASTIMTIGAKYVQKIGEAFNAASGDRAGEGLLRWEVTEDWMSPVLVTAPHAAPELTVLCMGMKADEKHYKNTFHPRPDNFIFP